MTRNKRRRNATALQAQAVADHTDDELARLYDRVHPPTTPAPVASKSAEVTSPPTCAYCGTVAASTANVTAVGLDGRSHVYGCCIDCRHLHDGASSAVVIAGLLDIDVVEVLDHVALERFANVPGSRPDRPNPAPWGHIDRRALARHIAEVAAQLAADSDAPCQLCGDTRRTDGEGHNANGWCAACQWQLDRAGLTDDERRDYAVAWLVGIAGPQPGVGAGRRGIGARVGFKFWHELDDTDRVGRRSCFGWYTVDDLVAWRRELHPDPPARPEQIVTRLVYPYGACSGPRRRTRCVPGYTPPDAARLVEARRARW